MNIGAAIRKARLAAGYSQDDLAYLVGMYRVYISRLENGRAVPRIEQVMRIATALGIETWQIIRDAEDTVTVPLPVSSVNPEVAVS